MDLTWAHDPLLLLVNLLAAFRLARLVVDDAVPFGTLREALISKLNKRELADGPGVFVFAAVNGGADVDSDGEVESPEQRRARFRRNAYEGQHPLSYLLSCYWCVGMYTSAATVLLASTGTWWLWVAVPLALSAAVGFLARLAD